MFFYTLQIINDCISFSIIDKFLLSTKIRTVRTEILTNLSVKKLHHQTIIWSRFCKNAKKRERKNHPLCCGLSRRLQQYRLLNECNEHTVKQQQYQMNDRKLILSTDEDKKCIV